MGIAARINAERVVLFGWPRAILLQLAHPLIAAGVAEHSSFRAGPFTAVARLHHTIRAMLALTFGDDLARQAAIDGIRAIHRRVHGHLSSPVGPFEAGTPYSAEDPELLLWVHATLLDSIPLIYTHLVAPLSNDERDAYCAEAAHTAVALGARDGDVPRSWMAVQEYLARTLASGRLTVSPQAREVADAVLRTRVDFLAGPLSATHRDITIGLLPADLRVQYGYAWGEDGQRRFERAVRLVRGVRRVLPARLALWPDARRGG